MDQNAGAIRVSVDRQHPGIQLVCRGFRRRPKTDLAGKPETASRVKQRCDAVMNWCAAHGHIVASPVGVVSQLLPKQPGKRERVANQPAVPWRDVPAFVQGVLCSGLQTRSKLMLEILIITAARSGEVRLMEWRELDLEKGIWTLPAQRMKAKLAHRVPLSPYLIELFEGLREEADLGAVELVFPSRNNTPVSDMTLTKWLRDHKVASDTPGRIATAHGFRSSFRDWASENGYPRDLAERALAHDQECDRGSLSPDGPLGPTAGRDAGVGKLGVAERVCRSTNDACCKRLSGNFL